MNIAVAFEKEDTVVASDEEWGTGASATVWQICFTCFLKILFRNYIRLHANLEE